MWSRCPLTCCFCAGSSGEWVWHEPFERGVFVSFTPLDLLVFKGRHFGDLFIWYRSQELECLMWSSNLLLLKDILCICETALAVGHPSTGGVFGHTAFLPVYPVSVWSFYPLLWRSCWAGFHVFFGENCSVCSCRFAVFWVFLYHHVVLPPLWRFFFKQEIM